MVARLFMRSKSYSRQLATVILTIPEIYGVSMTQMHTFTTEILIRIKSNWIDGNQSAIGKFERARSSDNLGL